MGAESQGGVGLRAPFEEGRSPSGSAYLGTTPVWVYAIILVMACIVPATHLWIASSETAEAVPTGLTNADSAIYLQTMRMLRNDFYSPYATVKAPNGPNDVGFLAAPFHWLYALIGLGADFFGVDDFIFLGFANGVFGGIYLLVVYGFLRAAAPRQANLAFLLLTVSGGLGGLLFVATSFMGQQGSQTFEMVFSRFSMYELIEGPYLSPFQHITRLYYTVSLALGLGALTALIRALNHQRDRYLVLSCFLLFWCTLIHVRIGGFLWAVGMIHLVSRGDLTKRDLARVGAVFTAPLLVSFSVFAAMSVMSPVFMQNTTVLVRESMWLTPFVSAALFQLLLIPVVLKRLLGNLPPMLFVGCAAAVGYLTTFGLLFGGHQLYHGNVLGIGDASAAARISDFALMGIPIGAALGWTRRPTSWSRDASGIAWVAPWLLIFLAIAVSAWGRGWFLSLTPQRLMLVLGIPLSILSAAALQRIAERRPRLSRAYCTGMVFCGIISLSVSVLYFHGPMGRQPGQGAFAHLHRSMMTVDDARLLDHLGDGVVLAPATFSDVIALRPGLRVLSGAGTTDLSDQMSTQMEPRVAAFFSLDSDDERVAFIREWRVDYVYCPDTWPVGPKIIASLKAAPWLDVLAESEHGAVFRFRG